MPTATWDRKDQNLTDIFNGWYRDSTVPTSHQLVLINDADAVITDSDATLLASEVSGNGYSRPTITFNAPTANSGTVNMVSNAALVTASGGTITYTHALVIDNTNKVEMMCSFGGTQTIVDGATHSFTVNFNVTG